ncbi:MAG: tRNA 5'-guanylyltransferase [Methanosarcinales archaeon]|nr:tRNA 5'-guanylyltransferase [Methanosarcinales archaeon]
MKVADFRNHEVYSDLRVVPPIIIRVDGRNFKNLLHKHEFEKPFDHRFASAVVDSAESFFREGGVHPSIAYIFSDEINILFTDALPFTGRVEKLVSVVSSHIASALTSSLGLCPIAFDGRVIPLHPEQVIEYLVWRQTEAWRNCVNSYGYYMLRRTGLSGDCAASRLLGLSLPDIHELCFQNGINLDSVPAWQRRGVMIYRAGYEKRGYDPIRKVEVVANRTKLVSDWDLPIFASDAGIEMLREIVPENR